TRRHSAPADIERAGQLARPLLYCARVWAVLLILSLDPRLVSQVTWKVVTVALHGLGTVGLTRRNMPLVVVRVLVAIAVAELLHQRGRGVPQVQWYGLVPSRDR